MFHVFVFQCDDLVESCENLIRRSRDSLTIQPAFLETAIVHKKPGEELGMHIQSSYNGTHMIGTVLRDSPAFSCSKIGEGDEVVQVVNLTSSYPPLPPFLW